MTAWVRKHGGAVYLTVLVLLGMGGSYYLAAHNAASLTELCQAGNVSRAQQITLWEHLVVISRPPAHETVQARNERVRTTRAFLAYVRRIFAARDCHHITR